MPNEITRYIAELNRLYKAGNTTGHSYCPALQNLLQNIIAPLQVTNEPKRIACGAPDFIVMRDAIPLGYIEAKDVGTDLNGKAHKAQFDRYKRSLQNLIITDYLTFQLFDNGVELMVVSIARVVGSDIIPDESAFNAFKILLTAFPVMPVIP